MELFLTRQHNGLYMLTAKEPIIAKVEGRDFEDAYVAPGEPVGMRNFCDLILKMLDIKEPIRKGQTVKVRIEGTILA